MAEYEFNTTDGQEIGREMMVLYLNTGTKEAPTWSPIGYRIEESDVELDWQRESKKDIMGQTYTNMKKPVKTQSFNEWPFRKGDNALEKLWKMAVKDEDAQALCALDLLTVHNYAGTKGMAAFAVREDESSIEMTRYGGSGGGSLTGDFTATFGGKRSVGTAKIEESGVTFTPEEAA